MMSKQTEAHHTFTPEVEAVLRRSSAGGGKAITLDGLTNAVVHLLKRRWPRHAAVPYAAEATRMEAVPDGTLDVSPADGSAITRLARNALEGAMAFARTEGRREVELPDLWRSLCQRDEVRQLLKGAIEGNDEIGLR